MIKKVIELKNCGHDIFSDTGKCYKFKISLCQSALKEFWEIPKKEIKKIWVSLYDRRVANSHRIELKAHSKNNELILVETYKSGFTIAKCFGLKIGQIFYVTLDYEEKRNEV